MEKEALARIARDARLTYNWNSQEREAGETTA